MKSKLELAKDSFKKEWKSGLKAPKTMLIIGLSGLTLGYVLGHHVDNRISGTVATYKGGEITRADLYNQLKNNTTGSGLVKSKLLLEIFNNDYGNLITDKQTSQAMNYYSSNDKEGVKKQLAFELGIKKGLTVSDKELKERFSDYKAPLKYRFTTYQTEKEADEVLEALANESMDKLEQVTNSLAGSGEELTYTNGWEFSYEDTTGLLPPEIAEMLYQMKLGDKKVIPYNLISQTGEQTTYYYVLELTEEPNRSTNWKDHKTGLTNYVKNIKGSGEDVLPVIQKVFKKNNLKIQDDYLRKALKDYTG